MQPLHGWAATNQEVSYPWKILGIGWTWVLGGWESACLHSACLVPTNFLLKVMTLVRNDALLGSFQPLQRGRSRTWEKESWQCHVPQREHTPGYSEHYGEKHEVNSVGCLRWRSMAAINPAGGILPICETPLWLCGVENISSDHTLTINRVWLNCPSTLVRWAANVLFHSKHSPFLSSRSNGNRRGLGGRGGGGGTAMTLYNIWTTATPSVRPLQWHSSNWGSAEKSQPVHECCCGSRPWATTLVFFSSYWTPFLGSPLHVPGQIRDLIADFKSSKVITACKKKGKEKNE